MLTLIICIQCHETSERTILLSAFILSPAESKWHVLLKVVRYYVSTVDFLLSTCAAGQSRDTPFSMCTDWSQNVETL